MPADPYQQLVAWWNAVRHSNEWRQYLPAPAPPVASTPYDAAHQALHLTPQERGLYERHLANLAGPGSVRHPNGAISTLYQMSVGGPGGLTYNIPSVYNGRILPPDQAIRNAAQQGWQTFPGYATPAQAESRYDAMHTYMDQDTQRGR